jgi:hypothetical protein
MNNTFPLFQNLISESDEKDLTQVQKKAFIKKLDKIDQDGINLIYALISSFWIYEKNELDSKIPYKGEVYDKDITFDLDLFPKKLKQILYKFIQMHVKKMNEDKKIQEKRN